MSFPAVVSRIAHRSSVEAPSSMPEGNWWEALPEDFAEQPEGFDLALLDRLQVEATAASDVVLRTLGACLVGTLAVPLGYHPLKLRAALADRDFYGGIAEGRDATRFFKAPPTGVPIRSKKVRLNLFRPEDGSIEDLTFESPFEPVNPRERSPYLRHKRNRVAHLRLFRHHDGPRPMIFAIHGFSADLYLVNEWFFALPWLYKMGFDVALFTLPFHGARQPLFSPFSGHGFFAGGARRINECFAHAVFDFRIFLDHFLHERGVPRAGVSGVSLGGFTTALLAATEPRLSFAIPQVPLASVADLVLEWEPIGSVLRLGLSAFGKSLKDFRYLLAASSPLSYRPVLPKERLMVIGGVGDRLASPKHTRLLWDHWGRCRLHWFPGSHLIHLDRGRYLRQVARFLRSIDFYQGLAPRRK